MRDSPSHGFRDPLPVVEGLVAEMVERPRVVRSVNELKKVKELEAENARLKCMYAELALSGFELVRP